MTDLTLGNYTLDNGLAGLKTACNEIWVCSAAPSDYASAVTNQLGTKSFGAGSAFDTVGAGSPAGRAISSIAVTDGTIATTGTVVCWAAVDSSGSALLAQGTLSGGGSVTATQTWTLDAFSIHLNGAAGAGDSTAATNFDTRAVAAYPSLDTAHRNAYKAFLNGLTTDGLIASDGTSVYFDALYVFATADRSVAVLNLINSSFNLTTAGTVNFVAGGSGAGGFTTNDGSAADCYETGLAENAGVAFLQDHGHFSAWCAALGFAGMPIGTTSANNYMFPEFGGTTFYARVQEQTSGGVSNGGVAGHFLGNRSAGSGVGCEQLYQNGSPVGTADVTSAAVASDTFTIPYAYTRWTGQIMAASIGGDLSATQVGYFYSRLHTLLQAIAEVT